MPDASTLWLKINYFRLTHIQDVRKWWVIIFIALDVFLFVFCLTNVVMYLIDMPRQKRVIEAMAGEIVAYQTFREYNQPLALTVTATSMIPTGGGKYDVVAQVKNENKQWAGHQVTYKFTINGQETDPVTDFILPQSEKYVIALGLKGPAASAIAQATFAITAVSWQRVPPSAAVTTNQFLIDDVDYSASATVDRTTIQQVRATITNGGFVGFWQTKFVVVLRQGTKIIGLTTVRLDSFRAGEKRQLVAQMAVSGTPTEAVVVPDINFLDTENFMK